jgi:hypothetical protein
MVLLRIAAAAWLAFIVFATLSSRPSLVDARRT